VELPLIWWLSHARCGYFRELGISPSGALIDALIATNTGQRSGPVLISFYFTKRKLSTEYTQNNSSAIYQYFMESEHCVKPALSLIPSSLAAPAAGAAPPDSS